MWQNLDVSPGWWLDRLGASPLMAPQHPQRGDLFTARFLWGGPRQERRAPRAKSLAASCGRPSSSSTAGLHLSLRFLPASSTGLEREQPPFSKDRRPRRAGPGRHAPWGVLPTAGSANSLHLRALYKQRQCARPMPKSSNGQQPGRACT